MMVAIETDDKLTIKLHDFHPLAIFTVSNKLHSILLKLGYIVRVDLHKKVQNHNDLQFYIDL